MSEQPSSDSSQAPSAATSPAWVIACPVVVAAVMPPALSLVFFSLPLGNYADACRCDSGIDRSPREIRLVALQIEPHPAEQEIGQRVGRTDRLDRKSVV